MNHRQIASFLCIMPPADHRVTTADLSTTRLWARKSRAVTAVHPLDARL